jgi:hypothetical protein
VQAVAGIADPGRPVASARRAYERTAQERPSIPPWLLSLVLGQGTDARRGNIL